jgi:predicted dehydrogenase
MGITHFAILRPHPSVKIVAVCDQSSTMLKVVSKYLEVAAFSDYKKMFNDVEMDCVIVSTPSDSHSEIIREAVSRNLHVFVEKPFTLNSTEGKQLVSALEGKNLVNQVGYVSRFHEVFTEVKRLLSAGVLGSIKHFSSEMYGSSVLKDSKSSWRSKRETGGGCLYEFASHCIDLTIFLLGCPDQVTGSVMQSVYSSEVEDLVSATFLYAKGYSGSIMVNWSDETFRKPTTIVKIVGTEGKIIADRYGYKLYLRYNDPKPGFNKGWNERSVTDISKGVRYYLRGNDFTEQLDYFVDCINRKTVGNICNFTDGLMTDMVMETITEDATRSNKMAIGGNVSEADAKTSTNSENFWGRIFK